MRAVITFLMWITYLIFIGVTMFNMPNFAIPLACIMMLPLIVTMVFVWDVVKYMEGNDHKAGVQVDLESEKAKRDRLDAVLRDLSDDDLMRLRDRIQNGTVDDDVLYRRLTGDDGELLTDEGRY